MSYGSESGGCSAVVSVSEAGLYGACECCCFCVAFADDEIGGSAGCEELSASADDCWCGGSSAGFCGVGGVALSAGFYVR